MLLSFSNETSSEAFLFPDMLRLALTKYKRMARRIRWTGKREVLVYTIQEFEEVGCGTYSVVTAQAGLQLLSVVLYRILKAALQLATTFANPGALRTLSAAPKAVSS
jgi:hypothetical protein